MKKLGVSFLIAVAAVFLWWSGPYLASLPAYLMATRPQPLPVPAQQPLPTSEPSTVMETAVPEPTALPAATAVPEPAALPTIKPTTPPSLPTAVPTNTPTSVIVVPQTDEPEPTIDWVPKINAAQRFLTESLYTLKLCGEDARAGALEIPPRIVNCTAPATAVKQAESNYAILQAQIEEYNLSRPEENQ